MIKVVLHSIANAGPHQEEFARRAVALLARVANSAVFAEEIRQTQFTYIDRADDDNQQTDILQAIVDGQESNTKPDGTIDLTISLENFRYGRFIPNHKTVGKTPVGGPVIRTSYYFMNIWLSSDDRPSLAGHFMHEWMHVAGYAHQTAEGDPGDVPYAIGNLVEELGRELLRAEGNSPPAAIGMQ